MMLSSLWAWSRLVFCLAEWGLLAVFMMAFVVNVVTGTRLLPPLPVKNAVSIRLLLAQLAAVGLDFPRCILRTIVDGVSLLAHGLFVALTVINVIV